MYYLLLEVCLFMDNYNLRLFESGDEGELTDLLELCFGGWPKFDLNCSVLDYWRWKHLDNPLGPSVVILAKTGDQLMGCNHGIPLNIKIFNNIYPCSQGTDDSVSPNFRGMGISKELQNMRLDVEKKKFWALNYGVIGDPILVKSYKKRYNFLPIKISNLIKVKDIELHLDMVNDKYKIFKKYGYCFSSYLNNITTSKRITSLNYNVDIIDINHFDESYDIFWNNIKNNYSFILVKNKKYLNWRYCDPRSGSYIIKIAKQGEQIVGYIILRINRYDKKYPRGYIVDLISLQNFYDASYMLVQNALRYFEEKNVNVIAVYFAENSKYENILKTFEFIKVPNKMHIFYQHLNNDINIGELIREDPNKIQFTMGDTDWI